MKPNRPKNLWQQLVQLARPPQAPPPAPATSEEVDRIVSALEWTPARETAGTGEAPAWDTWLWPLLGFRALPIAALILVLTLIYKPSNSNQAIASADAADGRFREGRNHYPDPVSLVPSG